MLAQLRDAMTSNPDWNIRIEGHTDAQGSDDYNLRLSDDRAKSVRDWLIGQGIAAARLQTQGFGETMPVSDNATPQGRALNRRVEIVRLQ